MKQKNTYSLLVNSEEKNRSMFEISVYGLLVASMAFSALAFATQSVVLPGKSKSPASAASSIEEPAQPVLIAARG
ncbi:MAG: hypothetical protein H0W20_12530 [Chthoniobacterales bacterium]|nr:hypothetical protein [Chthoniobacterales bacterium]